MFGAIIGAIIMGAVIGVLARLIMPGKQNIGMIMTVVLGIGGGLIGSWVTHAVGYANSNAGFEWIPFFVGILVAIGLIALYAGVIGRRAKTPRT